MKGPTLRQIMELGHQDRSPPSDVCRAPRLLGLLLLDLQNVADLQIICQFQEQKTSEKAIPTDR